MTRIACIFVPLFPLAARLRSEPELLSEAVARTKSIRPGMSLAQARSIVARARDTWMTQSS